MFDRILGRSHAGRNPPATNRRAGGANAYLRAITATPSRAISFLIAAALCMT